MKAARFVLLLVALQAAGLVTASAHAGALAVFAVRLAVGSVAKADPTVPCPRLVAQFERCNPGDPCYLVGQLPFPSPDIKFEAVEGTLYAFTRESGGAGSEWQTVGLFLGFEQRWESLYHSDLFERLVSRPDPACSIPTGGLELCEMTVSWDRSAAAYKATYLNQHCGVEPPRWVATDFWVESVTLETFNDSAIKPQYNCGDPTTCNVGFYMRPVNFSSWSPSLPGVVYNLQARSTEGGGRYNVELVWNRRSFQAR